MKLFSNITFTNQLFLRAFAILSFALLPIVMISAPARAELRYRQAVTGTISP